MFERPWKVIDKDSIEGGMPSRGEIIKHKSGAVILRCPACNSMQFAHSTVSGPDDAPTLSKPIQCGSGHCTRCAVWFSVDAGKTVEAEAPGKPARPIPTKLVEAGVTRPPKLPPELR